MESPRWTAVSLWWLFLVTAHRAKIRTPFGNRSGSTAPAAPAPAAADTQFNDQGYGDRQTFARRIPERTLAASKSLGPHAIAPGVVTQLSMLGSTLPRPAGRLCVRKTTFFRWMSADRISNRASMVCLAFHYFGRCVPQRLALTAEVGQCQRLLHPFVGLVCPHGFIDRRRFSFIY